VSRDLQPLLTSRCSDFPPPPATLYPPAAYGSSPYAAYPGYYPPQPPPPPKSSSLPAWAWVALGVLLAGLGGKLLEAGKAKQADIQQAMMQQMLKSMMGSAGAPGAPPPGFPGFPPPGGFARPPPPPAAAPSKGTTVDTTATAVKASAAPAAAPAAAAAAAPAPAAPPVEPASAAPPPPRSERSSYFSDTEVVDVPPTPAPPPFPAGSPPPPGMSVDVLEQMMRNPEMQKLIYPYLPEGMRNPQTFDWMLQNPATRKQLESMLAANGGGGFAGGFPGGMPPNLDMNSPEVKEQFEAMGMKPEEVVSKIMGNPEMTAAFQNPRIQAAIMDCSQNPMNISKYQDDKEVMDCFTKISELFPQAGGMPPPGFGR